MKYMLLIYRAGIEWTEEERARCMLESKNIFDERNSKGKIIASSLLHSVTKAMSVQIRDGRRHVTDGPFIETKEQLGGYFLIRVASPEEAIDIAARIPGSRRGTAEIHQLFLPPGSDRVERDAAT